MDCAAVSARSEESVLRKHLRGLTKNGSTWTGYVESKESFEEFERDLAAAYVSFQTEHSIKLKGSSNALCCFRWRLNIDQRMGQCSKSSFHIYTGRLLFSSQRGHVVVNGDVPFKVVQSVEKGCLFGRDLKKVQDSRSSQVSTNNGYLCSVPLNSVSKGLPCERGRVFSPPLVGLFSSANTLQKSNTARCLQMPISRSHYLLLVTIKKKKKIKGFT